MSLEIKVKYLCLYFVNKTVITTLTWCVLVNVADLLWYGLLIIAMTPICFVMGSVWSKRRKIVEDLSETLLTKSPARWQNSFSLVSTSLVIACVGLCEGVWSSLGKEWWLSRPHAEVRHYTIPNLVLGCRVRVDSSICYIHIRFSSRVCRPILIWYCFSTRFHLTV